MTSTLNHRGPDGFGNELISEANFQVGLGHRRLSIIDLTENAQTTNAVIISFRLLLMAKFIIIRK